MTTAYLDEFQHEFEQEQTRVLRNRVFWFCTVNFAFGLLVLFITLLVRKYSAGGTRETVLWLTSIISALFPTLYAALEAVDARRTERTREARLRRVSTYIAVSGIVSSVAIFVFGAVSRTGASVVGLLAFQQVFSVFLAHFLACCFLPWNWRESVRPFMPMFLLNAVGMAALWVIVGEGFDYFDIAFIMLYALGCIGAVMPGIGIAYWRNNRFAQEFTMRAVAGRYGEMRRELSGAQRIHEALFPSPETRGAIRFDYRYQPMRSIGGDYLYARFITTDDRRDPQLLVLLLDVTGHGIPAALTVNRLYGELERLVAEHPTIMPTALLRALNRYCHLTLMDHSLFVTACAFRIDPASERLVYANAGHPPAFVRSGGVLSELEPTAMVLGVAKDLDVEAEDPSIPFRPGDTLLAYTDGAMETRDKHGRMFNCEGIRDAMLGCEPDSRVCGEVLSAVGRHRYGPLTDDTLVVEISRLVNVVYTGAPAANGHAQATPTVASTHAQRANTSAS